MNISNRFGGDPIDTLFFGGWVFIWLHHYHLTKYIHHIWSLHPPTSWSFRRRLCSCQENNGSGYWLNIRKKATKFQKKLIFSHVCDTNKVYRRHFFLPHLTRIHSFMPSSTDRSASKICWDSTFLVNQRDDKWKMHHISLNSPTCVSKTQRFSTSTLSFWDDMTEFVIWLDVESRFWISCSHATVSL